MAITTALIKELRERTGAGMLDCKKALGENDGDIEKAIELGDNDTGAYSLVLLYSDENFLKLLNLTAKEKTEKKNIVDKYVKQLSDVGFTHEKLKELRSHKQMALIGNAYSIYRLAVHYSGTKNYKMAEKYAKDFLEFDNENPEILNILKNISK